MSDWKSALDLEALRLQWLQKKDAIDVRGVLEVIALAESLRTALTESRREVERLNRSAAGWEADAKRYCESADYWRAQAEGMKANNELIETCLSRREDSLKASEAKNATLRQEVERLKLENGARLYQVETLERDIPALRRQVEEQAAKLAVFEKANDYLKRQAREWQDAKEQAESSLTRLRSVLAKKDDAFVTFIAGAKLRLKEQDQPYLRWMVDIAQAALSLTPSVMADASSTESREETK